MDVSRAEVNDLLQFTGSRDEPGQLDLFNTAKGKPTAPASSLTNRVGPKRATPAPRLFRT